MSFPIVLAWVVLSLVVGPFVPCLAGAESARAGALSLGPRAEIKHQGKAHEVHLSGVAVASVPDGGTLLTWAAAEGEVNHVYVARIGNGEATPRRVNPADLAVDALHHPPRLAVAQTGEVYLSWSSAKPKPEGTLFASDLRLSRSLDGGASFTEHLRVNDDRPISHSFDGLAVGSDGVVLVSWVDSRAGGSNAGTYVARVADEG